MVSANTLHTLPSYFITDVMEVDRGKDGEANNHEDEKPGWLYTLLLQLIGHYPNSA
jgi:hypothetical protein